MTFPEAEAFLQAAESALAREEVALLLELHRFTRARREAAGQQLEEISRLLGAGHGAEKIPSALHAFLRESWECLDGLAREANLCLFRMFPGAGLYPPHQMTRQCGFYMVRKILHAHPDASRHPVAKLLWDGTRAEPAPAYRRLSFLYNLSVFAPVPLPGGSTLPGSAELPQPLRPLIRDQAVESCPVLEGLREIDDWVAAFLREAYGLLADALWTSGGRAEGT